MVDCKKDIIDSYCEWVFPILFEFEKMVNIESLDGYNKRLYGFLTERLFNIWLIHEKYKTYEVEVIQSSVFPIRQEEKANKFSLKTAIRHIIYKLYGKHCLINVLQSSAKEK